MNSSILRSILGAAIYVPRIAHISYQVKRKFPEFLPLLEQGFDDFLAHLGEDENTAEYLIPKYIAKLLLQKKATKVSVKVLNTDEQWFGVTYREDKDAVVAAFEKLVEQGVYDADLFAAWR